MKPHFSNPSFLNTQKIKIHTIDHSAHSQFINKKKLYSSSKNKYHKPIISFLNFSKDKQIHHHQSQPPTIPTLPSNIKEETLEFHQFQEHQNSISQIGSQYGQKNYDHQLKQVLKKYKRSERKSYQIPKAILRVNTQHKQNLESPTSKYERFEKFQSQMHKNTNNLKQELVNYQTYDLQGVNSKKLSGFCPQSQKLQHRIKTEFNCKYSEFITDPQFYENKLQTEYNQYMPESETSTFRQLQIDSTTTFQPIEFRKVTNKMSPSHRRSRTQDDIPLHDKEKAEQIFENYHKLKKTHFKVAKNKDSLSQNKFKPATPASIQLCEKQARIKQNYKQMQKEDKKHYRSLPKCQPMTISQNIYHFNSPTSRVTMTPKSLTRVNMDEHTLNKMIKQRKRDFFERTNNKPFELSNFTFEQIKQKLSKLELNDSKKSHNKSQNVLGGKKNVLLYSQLFVNGDMAKQGVQQNRDRQKMIKFKGIAFKANLIRKHTDIYEKHLKKIIDKDLSLKVTPKVSQVAI